MLFEGRRMQPDFALLVTEFTRLNNFCSFVFRLELGKFRSRWGAIFKTAWRNRRHCTVTGQCYQVVAYHIRWGEK